MGSCHRYEMPVLSLVPMAPFLDPTVIQKDVFIFIFKLFSPRDMLFPNCLLDYFSALNGFDSTSLRKERFVT